MSALIAEALEEDGVELLVGRKAVAVSRDGDKRVVRFEDGRRFVPRRSSSPADVGPASAISVSRRLGSSPALKRLESTSAAGQPRECGRSVT